MGGRGKCLFGFSSKDVVKTRDVEVKNLRSLNSVRDPMVYDELKKAISRYHAIFGVRQREIKIGDIIGVSANGVHFNKEGESYLIVLNRERFNLDKKEIENLVHKAYESGWSTRTKKPVQHTIKHELAHATWNSGLSGKNKVAAREEIRKLYNNWSKDTRKKGYGELAKENINEFWVETVTKALHGNQDKYTRKVRYIARKYKL